MRVLAIIASSSGSEGTPLLAVSDRAAAAWGSAFGGEDGVVRVADRDRAARAYGLAVGALVASWNQPVAPDTQLVLIGGGAIECYGDELAGHAAECLSAELLFDVLDVRREGEEWRVTGDAGRGARDLHIAPGPLVLVLSENVPRPRYVSRHRLGLAGRGAGPAQFFPVEALPPVSRWQPLTPRGPRVQAPSAADADVRMNSAFSIQRGASTARETEIISGDSTFCAQMLLRYLAHHGFVDRVVPEPAAAVFAPAAGASPTTPQEQFALGGLSPLARRRPRFDGEAEARLARRPRLTGLTEQATRHAGRTVTSRIRRRPRLVHAPEVRRQRGPYP